MSGQAAVARTRRPWPVVLAALVLLVLAAIQVFTASLFLTSQEELIASVMRIYPSANGDDLADRIFAATSEGIVVHAMLLVVYLAAALAMRTRSPVVRTMVTMLALVATLTDALILGQLPALLPSQAATSTALLTANTGLRALLIALVWLPAPARAWYARKAE